jgi:hypothetical protein
MGADPEALDVVGQEGVRRKFFVEHGSIIGGVSQCINDHPFVVYQQYFCPKPFPSLSRVSLRQNTIGKVLRMISL